VSDLDRSIAFYRDVVGLPLALEVPERGSAFFWIGGPGEAMLGLWSLGSAPVGLSLHIALKASLEGVLGACDALRSIDVTPLSFFGTQTTEPSVIGWMPAAAVYFRDPDGHLIEYLAMLDEPPRPEQRRPAASRTPQTIMGSPPNRTADGARCPTSARAASREPSPLEIGFYFPMAMRKPAARRRHTRRSSNPAVGVSLSRARTVPGRAAPRSGKRACGRGARVQVVGGRQRA
jgi:lactoylglutathione lyase